MIRAFIARGDALRAAKDIMSKHTLHVDQAGVVEHEILLLLIGLQDPVQFTEALKNDAGLDQATAEQIIQEVNERVFVPLRKQMQEASKSPVSQTIPRASFQTPKPKIPNSVTSLPTYVPPSSPVLPKTMLAPQLSASLLIPESVAPMTAQSTSLEPQEGTTMGTLHPLRHLNLLEHEDAKDLEAVPFSVPVEAVTDAHRVVPAPLPPKAALPRQTLPVPPAPAPRPLVRPPAPPPPHLPGAPEPEASTQENYPADPYREPIE